MRESGRGQRQRGSAGIRLWQGLLGALLLALLLMGLGLLSALGRPGRVLEADILFLGDSIAGKCRDETSVTALLEQAAGKRVFNGALGGTTLSCQNREHRDTVMKDALSLEGLTEALVYRDFGVQKNVTVRENGTESFGELVDRLEALDLPRVELLVLEYGTNDYFAGSPIANPEDPFDKYTVEGALRTSLALLREKEPSLRVLVLSPTYNWYLNTGKTCEDIQFGGGYLKEYADALERVSGEFGLEYLNLYEDFYPHESYEDWRLYTEDGVHPNQAGREKIARAVGEYLREHP